MVQTYYNWGQRADVRYVIKSIYTSVKSRVKTNNTLSESFSCSIGVRQGECLSPFLFAMYVNDLEQELSEKGGKWNRYRHGKSFASTLRG